MFRLLLPVALQRRHRREDATPAVEQAKVREDAPGHVRRPRLRLEQGPRFGAHVPEGPQQGIVAELEGFGRLLDVVVVERHPEKSSTSHVW